METLRAYRITLDPTAAQVDLLRQHAGAARWAYNLALAAKVTARREWETRVRAAVGDGTDLAAARSAVKVKVPSSVLIDKARVRVRGTDRHGAPSTPDWIEAQRVLVDGGVDEDTATAVLAAWAERCADPAHGIQPWAPSVPNGLIQRGEKDADRAWSNWLDSFKGRRAGRRVGLPRFKRRGGRDSFYLTNMECRLVAGSYRRVRLGGVLDEVRTLQSTKRINRALTRRSGVIQSVTVSRGAHRWYASILVKEFVPEARPSRAQRAAGPVGVSVGIQDHRLVLSTGDVIENPKIGDAMQRRIVEAQRRLSRTGWIVGDDGRRRASRRRGKARERVARLHHATACRRVTRTHALTKIFTTKHVEVVVEDLDIIALTASARGTRQDRGRAVKAKAVVNRATLDVEPGEFRRQLQYKSAWYGSTLTVGDPVARPGCDIHGTAKAKPSPDVTCNCGLVADLATAQALVTKAVTGDVAPDRGETENARGATGKSGGSDAGRPTDPGGSPPGSDARASP
jgi:putative transposase